jgi:hypothetical protein
MILYNETNFTATRNDVCYYGTNLNQQLCMSVRTMVEDMKVTSKISMEFAGKIFIFLDFDGVTHPVTMCPDLQWYLDVSKGRMSAHEFYKASQEDAPIAGLKSKPAFSSAPLLQEVLDRHENVRIVITSNQRFRVRDHANNKDLLLAQRVVGMTSIASGIEDDSTGNPGGRGALARDWLAANGLSPETPWLAIDDEPGHWKGDACRLIETKPFKGFEANDAQRLDAHLLALNAAMRVPR